MKKIFLILSFILVFSCSNENEKTKIDESNNTKIIEDKKQDDTKVDNVKEDNSKEKLLIQFVELQKAIKEKDNQKIDEFISPDISLRFFPGMEENAEGKEAFINGHTYDILNNISLLEVSSDKVSVKEIKNRLFEKDYILGESYIDLLPKFVEEKLPNDIFEDFETIKEGSLFISQKIRDNVGEAELTFVFEMKNEKLQLTRIYMITS